MVLWAAFGTFALILLTWQDYRNKMVVDDRRNWFMMGLSLGLIYIFRHSLWYMVLVAGLAIGLRIIFLITRPFGEADVNTFFWTFLGFGFINIGFLVWYLVILLGLTAIFSLFKRLFFRHKGKMPYYGVLLLSFVSACWLLGLY